MTRQRESPIRSHWPTGSSTANSSAATMLPATQTGDADVEISGRQEAAGLQRQC